MKTKKINQILLMLLAILMLLPLSSFCVRAEDISNQESEYQKEEEELKNLVSDIASGKTTLKEVYESEKHKPIKLEITQPEKQKVSLKGNIKKFIKDTSQGTVIEGRKLIKKNIGLISIIVLLIIIQQILKFRNMKRGDNTTWEQAEMDQEEFKQKQQI